MKLKKVLAVLFTTMMLLTLSSSVFAADVSPKIINIGDTRETALTLIPDQDYNLFLSDAQDVDWYKWTNNTGEGKFVVMWLYSSGSETTLDLAALIQYDSARETTLLHADPTKAGSTFPAIIRNLYIPNGASLFVRASAANFVSTEQYKLNFTVYN